MKFETMKEMVMMEFIRVVVTTKFQKLEEFL